MPISENFAEWVASFLINGTKQRKGSVIELKSKLVGHDFAFLKVPELKAVGNHFARHHEFQVLFPTLQKPKSSGKKKDWEIFCSQILGVILSNSYHISTSATPPNIFSFQTPPGGVNSPRQMGASMESDQFPMAHASRFRVNQWEPSAPPQHFASQNASMHPVAQPPMPIGKVEYYENIECIDICRYPNGLPLNLLTAYQQKSSHKGYPSRLRYEQVKIKKEKRESAQRPQSDAPQTPFEAHVVNSLRQMGCQDVQEILSSLRYVQKQNPMGGDSIIDMTLMHIVQQREERDEAKKMDDARIQSEQTILLEERNFTSEHAERSSYTNDEMLGFVGSKSTRFPNSYLLESSKIKTIFHTLLLTNVDDKGVIRQLLEIESKANKFYGEKVPEPFFRYILRAKLENWHEQFIGEATSPMQENEKATLIGKIKEEFLLIQNAMYSLSEQDESLQVPKLFISARTNAVANGLISHQPEDVIMIDDD